MLVSFVVNCSLVEVTLNPAFALYFGTLFLLIGALIIFRVRGSDHPHPYILYAFAAMTAGSGLLCILFDTTCLFELSAAVNV